MDDMTAERAILHIKLGYKCTDPIVGTIAEAFAVLEAMTAPRVPDVDEVARTLIAAWQNQARKDADELATLRERVKVLESKRNSELLFVGYTNGAQILYAADPNHGGQGSFFVDTENDTVIPLYMLRLHKHRLQGTTDGEVTAEMIEALHKAARLRGGSDE